MTSSEKSKPIASTPNEALVPRQQRGRTSETQCFASRIVPAQNEGRSGDQTRLRRYRRAAFWSASCNRTYRLKRGAGAGSPGPFNPVAADTGRKDRNAPRQLLPDLPLAALPHPQGRLGRGHPRTRAKDVIDENATIDQQSSGCSQNEPNFTLHSLGL
jgi:hypothetical protein